MRRLRRSDDGFSMTELVMVILIIGILMGIAIPVFLGLRRSAEDAAAKEAAVLALKVARTQVEEDYAVVTTATLEAAEPSLTFVDETDPSTGPTVVTQDVLSSETFVAAVYSQSGSCFFVKDDLDVGTLYGSVSVAPTNCVAADQGTVAFGDSW